MSTRSYSLIAVCLFLTAIVLTATTLATPTDARSIHAAAAQQQSTPAGPASQCAVGAAKAVAPYSLILGESAGVTLVFTHTCPPAPLPVDMVIVADQSFSMTRGQGGGLDPPSTLPPEPVTPDPSRPPPTPVPPGQTPGVGPQCVPPPFCSGSGSIRTAEPTATPTRWWQRTPTPRIRTPEPTPVQEHASGQDKVRDVRQWVGDFVGDPAIRADLASGRLLVGFVGFNRRAVVRQNLSSDPSAVTSSANRLRGADITNIRDALREAERILNGQGARTQHGDAGRQKVIVILSDFQFCPQDVQRLGGDITAIAVGFGVDRCDTDKQQRMASSRMWAFDGGRARDVVVAYQQSIGGAGKPVAVEDLAISDELAAAIELQWHSWHPPTATVSGARIVWPLLAPSSPITATYRVRPLIDGLLPVSVMAEAVYTDSLGLTGRVAFPPVHIHVTAHTPTPSPTWTPTPTLTATATSTPTSTPTPAARYLPVARKHWPPPTPTEKPCIPEEETVDVALVIDTSTSMADPTRSGGPPKMTAAVQAAQALLALLKADDQTAVIGFNAEATVLQGLTADRDAVVRALAGLADTQAVGTSIYRGLAAARAELEGPRHRPDNNPSIVLVTDGRHNDPLHGLDDVRSLAAAILADGIEIVTVGLGTDIDDDLLRDIASTPDYYFRAPDAADLLDIYREIARLIPCP